MVLDRGYEGRSRRTRLTREGGRTTRRLTVKLLTRRFWTQFFIHSSEAPRRKMPTAPMAALGSDYTSCSRLPWLMGATPLYVLNRERPCSSCACLAVLRTYRHELDPGGQL
jgi:hypothetical protein